MRALPDRTMMVSALALDLIGAAGALLIALRSWQTITTHRPAPFTTDVLDVTGRTVDSAPTAFALVALAGVVAVAATRGIARRAVGAVLLIAGAGIGWRSLQAANAVGISRARGLVVAHHSTVDVSSTTPRIVTHAAWPWLSLLCGALVFVSGALIVWRGQRWPALSARHDRATERAIDQQAENAIGPAEASLDDEAIQARRAKASAALWNELDRGEDPTR